MRYEAWDRYGWLAERVNAPRGNVVLDSAMLTFGCLKSLADDLSDGDLDAYHAAQCIDELRGLGVIQLTWIPEGD